MHIYAFIAILVPKLVDMLMPVCLLCTGLWALGGEVPQYRRMDRRLWDGPTSAVAPRPLSLLAQDEPISSRSAALLAVSK